MTDAEIKAYKVRLCREANPEKYKTYAKEWQKAKPRQVQSLHAELLSTQQGRTYRCRPGMASR